MAVRLFAYKYIKKNIGQEKGHLKECKQAKTDARNITTTSSNPPIHCFALVLTKLFLFVLPENRAGYILLS